MIHIGKQRKQRSQCVAEDSCVGGFPDLSKLSVEVPSVVATGVSRGSNLYQFP